MTASKHLIGKASRIISLALSMSLKRERLDFEWTGMLQVFIMLTTLEIGCPPDLVNVHTLIMAYSFVFQRTACLCDCI